MNETQNVCPATPKITLTVCPTDAPRPKIVTNFTRATLLLMKGAARRREAAITQNAENRMDSAKQTA